jgi:hypothetical protein
LLPSSVPPCVVFQVAGVLSRNTLRATSICAKASIDAAPKLPAALYRAAFNGICQWQNPRFHRFFAVFPGISLENAVFARFFGLVRAESREPRVFAMGFASDVPAVQSIPSIRPAQCAAAQYLFIRAACLPSTLGAAARAVPAVR